MSFWSLFWLDFKFSLFEFTCDFNYIEQHLLLYFMSSPTAVAALRNISIKYPQISPLLFSVCLSASLYLLSFSVLLHCHPFWNILKYLFNVVGWHHWVDRHEFEQGLGVGAGEGSVVCCSPWGCKECDTTEWLNWTDLFSDGENRKVGSIRFCFWLRRRNRDGILPFYLKQ